MPAFGSAFCFGTRIGFCYPWQKGQEDRLQVDLAIGIWLQISSDGPRRNQDWQDQQHRNRNRMKKDGQ